MEKSGIKWSAEYRKLTDKLIEEVTYTTQEEFHAYYKARDERYFAVIEGIAASLLFKCLCSVEFVIRILLFCSL